MKVTLLRKKIRKNKTTTFIVWAREKRKRWSCWVGYVVVVDTLLTITTHRSSSFILINRATHANLFAIQLYHLPKNVYCSAFDCAPIYNSFHRARQLYSVKIRAYAPIQTFKKKGDFVSAFTSFCQKKKLFGLTQITEQGMENRGWIGEKGGEEGGGGGGGRGKGCSQPT